RPVQYSTGEDQAYKIGSSFPQLNGLIAGHQHFSVSGHINDTAFVQPGSHGKQVGQMIFKKENGKWASETDLLSVEKETAQKNAAFDEWMQEEINWDSVYAFLKSYFLKSNEQLVFTAKGSTRQDLLNSFPI